MADLNMSGDKLYQKRARQALPLLVQHAKKYKRIISYSELAEKMGMPNPRNLNYVLGAIGFELLKIKEKGDLTPPPIQCLVVNKNKRLPGNRIAEFIDFKEGYEHASDLKKREIIEKYQKKVIAFNQWEKILELLELEPVK